MSEIHQSGPVTPREKKMFETEYKQGTVLFEKALHQTSKSDNPYQKEQFGDVMNKAMQVLNQAAKELKRNDLIEQNRKIEKDLKAYKEKPSEAGMKVLIEDLSKAKKSIE